MVQVDGNGFVCIILMNEEDFFLGRIPVKPAGRADGIQYTVGLRSVHKLPAY
jgi:hypothetical protein